MHGDFYTYSMTASKAILILLSFGILLRCLRSMLREEYDPETWAYLHYGRDRLPVQSWETIIGVPMNSARVICWFSVNMSITSEVIWLPWFHSTGLM